MCNVSVWNRLLPLFGHKIKYMLVAYFQMANTHCLFIQAADKNDAFGASFLHLTLMIAIKVLKFVQDK